MEMQDKELDELFRSKLDKMEINPSDGLWRKVVNELSSGKVKKNLTVLISIAASIIMLVTASLIFIPQKAKINNYPLVKNNLVLTESRSNKIGPSKINLNSNSLRYQGVNKVLNTPANTVSNSRIHHTLSIKKTIFRSETEKVADKNDPVELVSFSQKSNTGTAILPGEETQLISKQSGEEVFVTNEPGVTTAQLPVINSIEPPVKTKHKISSLGDLINIVVNTVDKRKDKIIEFTNTEDEEDNITGVNLGFIKIKKDK